MVGGEVAWAVLMAMSPFRIKGVRINRNPLTNALEVRVTMDSL